MAGCVSNKAKEFIELQALYQASERTMKNAINGYMAKYNLEETPYEALDFQEYIKNFFHQGNTNLYYEENTQAAIEEWEKNKSKYKMGQPVAKWEADNLKNLLAQSYSFLNVFMYESSTPGKYIVQVAKPMSMSDPKATVLERVVNPEITLELKTLQESKALVDQMFKDAEEHIVVDKKAHTYAVDGKVTDTSVTKIKDAKALRADPTFKPTDYGQWGTPSSSIGNTADTVLRDYFDNDLKENYPNLNSKQLERLKEDSKDIRDYFDEKFGEGNYEVVTKEFPIAATLEYTDVFGKLLTMSVAGTMDMLVYDNKGNFYILDMKTSRSGINQADKEKYSRQLNTYKAILEANYPQLKGKILTLDLIELSVSYPAPHKWGSKVIDHDYRDGNPENGENPEQLYIDGKPIQDHPKYKAPKLKFKGDVQRSLKSLDIESLDESFSKLTQNERDLLEEEIGTKPVVNELESYVQSEIQAQRSKLFDSKFIPAQERNFLIKNVMKVVSDMITQLLNNPSTNERYFPDGDFEDSDFTTMSREEIIRTVGIGELLYLVKENHYNPERRKGELSTGVRDKLQHAYDNWGALVEAGTSTLIVLEGATLKRADASNVRRETGDPNADGAYDTIDLELASTESWQVGLRQISAVGSLSAEMRRAFEKLYVIDNNNERVKDKYGYGMDTFVDGTTAVNSILEWVKDATTIEEMETIILNQSTSNPWVNTVVQLIQNEPFRSQFYNNFRKDFSTYSTVVVNNINGELQYSIKMINTKPMVDIVLNEIAAAFKEGVMGDIIKAIPGELEGKGLVNKASLVNLKANRQAIFDKLLAVKGGQFKTALTESIPAIQELLTALGLNFDLKTIDSFMAEDLKKSRLNQTKVEKVLLSMSYMFDTLDANKDKTEYNPMLKEQKVGNIYSDYKNIVTQFSKYVQDSIEQSSYENGKMYYSFVTPSYLSNLITQLSNGAQDIGKFNNFIEEQYGSYKWFKDKNGWKNKWIELLQDPTNRREIQHKIQLNFNKNDYSELGELSYAMSLMTEYFYDETGNWAWYRVPTMSNKPSSEFIKFKRFKTDYKNKLSDYMVSTMDQEIMRIRTVIERAQAQAKGEKVISDIKFFDASGQLNKKGNEALKNKIKLGQELTREDLVRNGKLILAGTGAEFKFLEMFNKNIVTPGDLLGDLIIAKINGDISETDNNTLVDKFKENLKTYMSDVFNKEVKQWKSIGLFDKLESKDLNTGNITETYKYAQSLGLSKNATLELMKTQLEEYLWNDMFATINIVLLTVTDLAYSKNVEDFQKRFAQVHSPAMKLNISAKDSKGRLYSADGLSRTLYLADDYIISEIIPQLKTVFDRKVEDGAMTRQYADSILAQYGYSNTPDGKFVKSKTPSGEVVFIKTSKINVTDAQGYSSPTSYRKKLGMAGKWDDNMERAYDIIKSGDWNGKNLNVVWQPLKPFVYTQMRKNSGATAMSELKVPTQMKNSEFLLLMADAIIKGDKLTNRLSAIYDFMEESAYTDGKYNGKGIDTVQFESAIKSGLMGVIDINGAQSIEEIKNILKEHAYNGSEYHDQFVHEFSFNDYGIQQEIPAHLVDDARLMGSQMRILSISDLNDGDTFEVFGKDKRMTAQQVRTEYQQLMADNIRESYNTLLEDMKLTEDKNGNKFSKLERNKALEKILLLAMEADSKYDNDLITAVSLNPQGEFTIPLNDPIQSVRIQSLLNSIIKSRINKQKTSGGSMVQLSAYGFSEDLNIVWKDLDNSPVMSEIEFNNSNDKRSYKEYIDDKRQAVAYFEIFMPIPSSEMERALTKPDGSLMTPEEAIKLGVISEEQLKGIGYRIPTEDKYSLAPMRIKGFLPRSGEGIVLPKEITLISGSDFDIDKLYAIFKEFKKRPIDRPAIINDLLKDKTLRKLVSPRDNTDYRKSLEGIIDAVDLDLEFEEDSAEMYVAEYIQNSRVKYKDTGFDEYNNDSHEGRNNRIFNMQWAVLTHPDTASKMFNPGSFDDQKKTSRIVQVLKLADNKKSYEELKKLSLDELDDLLINSEAKNILFSSTQVYFQKLNMTAAKLIGVFATNNVSHAFLAMQDVKFNFKNNEGFTFNGVTVNNNMNNKIDSLKTLEGDQLISKVIAGFLAASVDAVKDPVLNFMNINGFTAKASMVLARLGFDSDSIGLLLTQPIVETVTREYAKQNNDGYASADTIINELFKKLKGFDSKSKAYQSNEFSKEWLAKQLSNYHGGNRESDLVYNQGMVLQLFQKLMKMGTDMGDLTFLTKYNSLSNAVGPGIADTLTLAHRHKKFMLTTMQDSNPPFTKEALNIIDNSPLLKAFYETTIGDDGAAKALFKPYFHHYTAKFENILSLFRDSVKGNLDSKLINKLVNDYVYYKMTMPSVVGNDVVEGAVFDGSFENRAKFINNFVGDFKRDAAGIIDNELINIITVKPKDRKMPVATLEARTGGYSVDLQEKIKDAWSTLIASEDPKIKELGVKLFFYNMMRSGFAFSPKSFMHLASADVKMEIMNYIERIRDVEFGDNYLDDAHFLLQFRRNHYANKKVNPVFTPSEDDPKPLKRLNIHGKHTVTFNFKKGSTSQDSIVLPTKGLNVDYSPTIMYDERFWVLHQGDKSSVTYTLSSTLGNTNNVLEYDATEKDNMVSSIGVALEIAKTEDDYSLNKNDQLEYEELGLQDIDDLRLAIRDKVLNVSELDFLKDARENTNQDYVKKLLKDILEIKLEQEQSEDIIKLMELAIKKLC